MSRKPGPPDDIERKENVPEEDWTQGKKEAADWIEEHVLAEGKWPMAYTEMEYESDWSRQHIANTVRDFFNDVSTEQQEISEEQMTESVYVGNNRVKKVEIEIPADVTSKESFIRGYVTAME